MDNLDNQALKHNTMASFSALIASSGTLVCCVLPAVMVSIGAGASLVGVLARFPQLIWLSEHKGLVFGFAITMLAVSGVMQYRARSLPCPVDPVLAKHCQKLRRTSFFLWLSATVITAIGFTFAFLLPMF